MSKDANPPPNPPPGDIPVGKLVRPAAKPAAKPAPPTTAAPEPAKKPVPIGPTIAMPFAAIPLAPPASPTPTATSPTPAPTAGDYDVELVAIPFPPATKPRLPRDQRPLYDMDRRDFLMLGGGVIGTVIAILVAMGLAKALRKKPPE